MRKTYLVVFEGGPLDGKGEYRPVQRGGNVRGWKHTPKAINKPLNRKTMGGWAREDIWYVSQEPSFAPKGGETLVFVFDRDYQPAELSTPCFDWAQR